MRKFKKQYLLFLTAIFFGVLSCGRIMSTGIFRKVKPINNTALLKSIPIAGAEDITVSYSDGFALVSATDRAMALKGEIPKSALYLLNLKSNSFTYINLTKVYAKQYAFLGVSLFKIAQNKYQVVAVNALKNAPPTIEIFSLNGDKLIHKKTLINPLIKYPNDVVIVAENKFYFTNDHGKTKKFGRTIEEYAGQKKCNVVYYNDGSFTEVAKKISFANGINVDMDRKLLYVASSRAFMVKVYQINADGTLGFIENIKCKTGVDNIEIDPNGVLWIAAHPKLLRYAAYADGKKDKSPSEVIKLTYNGKKDYQIEKIYVEHGDQISSSSVAVSYSNKLIIGSILDDHFLILKKNE